MLNVCTWTETQIFYLHLSEQYLKHISHYFKQSKKIKCYPSCIILYLVLKVGLHRIYILMVMNVVYTIYVCPVIDILISFDVLHVVIYVLVVDVKCCVYMSSCTYCTSCYFIVSVVHFLKSLF